MWNKRLLKYYGDKADGSKTLIQQNWKVMFIPLFGAKRLKSYFIADCYRKPRIYRVQWPEAQAMLAMGIVFLTLIVIGIAIGYMHIKESIPILFRPFIIGIALYLIQLLYGYLIIVLDRHLQISKERG